MAERDPYTLAVKLLARREHARGELAAKLSARGCPEGEITAALDRLAAQGYLDDARFAASCCREYLLVRGHGPLKVAATLRRRGVAEAVAERALAETLEGQDLGTLARKAAGERLGEAEGDRKARARLYRFLVRRGFPFDVARAVSGVDRAEGGVAR